MYQEKKVEIERYEKLIDTYGRGRWYWLYRRRLDEMKAELEQLVKSNPACHVTVPYDKG